MTDTETTPLARALGRVPSGLFIVTTVEDGAPLGFLASFVMQAGFDPPTVSVAVAKGRAHLDAIRASGRFAVSILDADSSHLMGPFFRKLEPGESSFDGLATERTPGDSTVLSEALAWLDCRHTGEYETGDHVIVYGEVTGGELKREGEPKTHTRKDGLSY
jgi:flavin reductase (DIM6/NTAB) family NADH-FMN oxidoreductase RutF